MITLKDTLEQVENNIEKPFVTSKFGNNWRKHTKENYDLDTVIDIAWRQGRKAILLERELVRLFDIRVVGFTLPNESKMVIERERQCTFRDDDDRDIKHMGLMAGFEKCYYWLKNL